MLKIFKTVSFFEGLSYVIMLLIGMPLKYMGDNDIIIKILGMPHGILFITYVVLAIQLKSTMAWPFKKFATILVASIVPFGTFYTNKKYFSNVEMLNLGMQKKK